MSANAPKNVKKQVVKRRKFKNIQTESEYIAEFSFRPGKCKKCYRMVVLKKIIKVTKDELKLFDDVRYFLHHKRDEDERQKLLCKAITPLAKSSQFIWLLSDRCRILRDTHLANSILAFKYGFRSSLSK